MLSRRRFVQAAGSALLLPEMGIARRRGGVGGIPIWRGNGQNMRYQVQGFGDGSNWSALYRSRHYSTVPFRYARFILPTFISTGTPIADTDFTASFNFQVGVEFPYTLSYSGIPPRTPATTNGGNTASYTPGAGPYGYVLTDVVDFGSVVPAYTYFGLWTTVENAAGSGSATNSLPYSVSASENYQSGYQRFSGATATATSMIASNAALTATSITPCGNTQSGSNGVYCPCAMLIQCDGQQPSTMGFGDSILYGIGEGGPGSLTSGDSLGSALANAGYGARYVFETLGQNFVNFGHGSDRYQYYSATNWKYRLLLATLCNPSSFLLQNSHNDASGGQSAALTISNAQACIAALRSAVPGVNIILACCTPDSQSTNSWIDATGQTARSGFGNSSSIRGTFNAAVRANTVGGKGFIDPNPALEYGYQEGVPADETSLWNFTGALYGYNQNDGTHPNSAGHALAAAAMYASLNGSQSANPFAT